MKNPHSIRRARPTDLPDVYVGELDYIRQIEPQQEARWKDGLYWHLRQWTDGLDRMFVVECGERLAGYCFWEIADDATILASIYVVPDQRRSGIGERLLARFVDDAKAQGFGKLLLGVKPDNPARHLYEKAGFIHTHDKGGYRHYGYSI